MPAKKKSALSPEAARILEQYRKAGKSGPVPADGSHAAEGDEAPGVPPARTTTPPPGGGAMRRSGTRGK